MGIVARQSIKGTLATYLGVAVGIVTTFFIQTKYLTPDEIGLVDVLIQSAVLFSGLAQLGTCNSAMRYYPAFKDPEQRDHGFFGWMLIIPFIGFALFLIAFFLFKGAIANYFSEKSSLFVDYIYFVIPLAFFMLYLSVFETNANLLMRIVVPRFMREVGLRLMALCIYLLYGFRVISLRGMVIAFCVSYAIATIVNVIYLFTLHRVSFKIDRKHITPQLKRDFLLYTLFMVAAALSGNITPMLNKYFLAGMDGLLSTGIFTIAVYIAVLVEMPYRSLGAINMPLISQAMSDGNTQEADRVCKSVSLHQFLVGSFIFFIIWINVDLVFDIMPNGSIYHAGKWVVFIIGISRLINSTLHVGITVLNYSKIYYYSLFFTILLTVLAIFLNLRLIPIWGMNGAALATLFAYTIHYVLLLALIRWKIGTSPLAIGHLKVLLVMVVLFGLDLLWRQFLTQPLLGLFGDAKLWYISLGALVEGVLRTLVLLAIGVWITYRLKVSHPVNDIFEKHLPFLNRKK